ncbi:MAG: CDP-alcohol phosphatidyltransferase family protein [Gammaproteobacteria bacterium]|nr:CDP-alcohol phosphatidyltransferase family protein [Gammaproteobacteria bacterium]
MSHDTWLHRLIRGAVRPLINTPVTPNHLTTVRLLTGVGAAALFAVPGYAWGAVGALLFMISMLFDRADGELARMSGKSSAFGHVYDLITDGICTVAAFVGIGFGLRSGTLGIWAPVLGIIAGVSVAVTFLVAEKIKTFTGAYAFDATHGVDPDDAMLVVPIAMLSGLGTVLLFAAAVGAPAFLIFSGLRLVMLKRRV